MEKKVLIGIIIIGVLVAGAYIIVSGRSKLETKTNTTDTNTNPDTGGCATGTRIIYRNNSFSPSCLKLKSGAAVTFENDGTGEIQIASNPHPTHSDHPILNEDLKLTRGQSTWQVILTQPSTYGYHNHMNPSHSGKIVVE